MLKHICSLQPSHPSTLLVLKRSIAIFQTNWTSTSTLNLPSAISNQTGTRLHSTQTATPSSSTSAKALLPNSIATASAEAAKFQQHKMIANNGDNAKPAHVLFDPTHPKPVRKEFLKASPLSTSELEQMNIGVGEHRVPRNFADWFAFAVVKGLRWPSDIFFKKRYIHRAVMLETVAAVPGMVAATLRHLKSLRRLEHDGGWISHLLSEAENERMHLLTWMRICAPSAGERLLVLTVQGIFYNAFFLLYLVSPRVAHRIVGYLEEEAVRSYTHFLEEIDNKSIPNIPAPQIAIEYWHLDANATLRDVVLAVRADEAQHRDVNHHFADRIYQHNEDLRTAIEISNRHV